MEPVKTILLSIKVNYFDSLMKLWLIKKQWAIVCLYLKSLWFLANEFKKKDRMLMYMVSPNTNIEPSSRHCLTDVNCFYTIEIKILGENKQ